jgi:hypothetical protein
MNPVEEFLSLKKTAGFGGSLWSGMKFQPAVGAGGMDTFANVLGNQLTAGAAVGGVTMGGEAALGGLRKLIGMGIDKWKKPMEYKAMLEAHPELQQQDAAKVQALYNSLRHMSPHMAKDPVIAGSFVRNLLERGNEGSVAVPMDTAKMLADTQKSVSGARGHNESQFPGFVSGGVGGAQKSMFEHGMRAPERAARESSKKEEHAGGHSHAPSRPGVDD